MKSKCGGCKAPSREDMAQPSAAAKPVTRRKAWNGPKERVSKVNRALRTAAKPLRRREARNAPQGVERAERKGEQSEPSVEDSGEAAPQTRSP